MYMLNVLPTPERQAVYGWSPYLTFRFWVTLTHSSRSFQDFLLVEKCIINQSLLNKLKAWLLEMLRGVGVMRALLGFLRTLSNWSPVSFWLCGYCCCSVGDVGTRAGPFALFWRFAVVLCIVCTSVFLRSFWKSLSLPFAAGIGSVCSLIGQMTHFNVKPNRLSVLFFLHLSISGGNGVVRLLVCSAISGTTTVTFLWASRVNYSRCLAAWSINPKPKGGRENAWEVLIP